MSGAGGSLATDFHFVMCDDCNASFVPLKSGCEEYPSSTCELCQGEALGSDRLHRVCAECSEKHQVCPYCAKPLRKEQKEKKEQVAAKDSPEASQSGSGCCIF